MDKGPSCIFAVAIAALGSLSIITNFFLGLDITGFFIFIVAVGSSLIRSGSREGAGATVGG